jgi:hypothetical protein
MGRAAVRSSGSNVSTEIAAVLIVEPDEREPRRLSAALTAPLCVRFADGHALGRARNAERGRVARIHRAGSSPRTRLAAPRRHSRRLACGCGVFGCAN